MKDYNEILKLTNTNRSMQIAPFPPFSSSAGRYGLPAVLSGHLQNINPAHEYV